MTVLALGWMHTAGGGGIQVNNEVSASPVNTQKAFWACRPKSFTLKWVQLCHVSAVRSDSISLQQKPYLIPTLAVAYAQDDIKKNIDGSGSSEAGFGRVSSADIIKKAWEHGFSQT